MRAGSCREISVPVWEASKFSGRSHTPARRRPLGLAVPIRERAENFKGLLMRGGNFVGSWRFSMRVSSSSHVFLPGGAPLPEGVTFIGVEINKGSKC
jgi:hypothetical protein